MILVIDNYDSFVYNLARYFEMGGSKTKVVRNDEITLDEIAALRPEALVLSPGPCTPKEAGICVDAVREFGSDMPIFGVCLGHQCIGEAYGGMTLHAAQPMHGKACEITHDGEDIFGGLPNPMIVGRYHSLITAPDKSSALKTTAQTEDGTIMAMRHETHPVYGVQFHPESVLTEHGLGLIQNFIALARAHNKKRIAA